MNMNRDVAQGKYKIIPKELGPLHTSGLATCSAIGFRINNIDTFLAHIDANTDVIGIANQIHKIYNQPIEYSDINIWYGSGMLVSSEHTQKLIRKFTILIGIDIDPKKELDDDLIPDVYKDIVECRLCKAKSGTLKIIPHCYTCKYAHNIIIRTVGFMDTVSKY